MNSLQERLIACDFDEVDMVLEADSRFTDVMEAVYEGEMELAETLIQHMRESGELRSSSVETEDVIEYNPEDDDAIGLLDATAEDYRAYMAEGDYSDDDGEIIDMVLDDDYYEDF